jgi:hypothetical protein
MEDLTLISLLTQAKWDNIDEHEHDINNEEDPADLHEPER